MDENLEMLEYIVKNSEMGVYSSNKLIKMLSDKENKIRKVVEDSVSGEIKTKTCKFDGTVLGYAGSTAQEFADKWKFKFVPLDADNTEYDISKIRNKG